MLFILYKQEISERKEGLYLVLKIYILFMVMCLVSIKCFIMHTCTQRYFPSCAVWYFPRWLLWLLWRLAPSRVLAAWDGKSLPITSKSPSNHLQLTSQLSCHAGQTQNGDKGDASMCPPAVVVSVAAGT